MNASAGWVSYCAIESFGSICVSLFWAFVNSSMDVEGAKSAYGLIIAGANLGSILGPTIAITKVCGGAAVLGVMDGVGRFSPARWVVRPFCFALVGVQTYVFNSHVDGVACSFFCFRVPVKSVQDRVLQAILFCRDLVSSFHLACGSAPLCAVCSHVLGHYWNRVFFFLLVFCFVLGRSLDAALTHVAV